MNKKVFAFDIDGTILNSNGNIVPETVVALKEAVAKGHIATLCSGRPYFDMLDIVEQGQGVFDYMICNNGAYFYDLKINKAFITKEVDKEVALAIFELEEKITQVSLRATNYCDKFSHQADIHVAGEVYLDVNPLDTSKLTGINDLGQYIGLSAKDFVAFGDSGNDLQMLKGAGLGISMGNGTAQAKEAAQIVIGDNNSTAIAKKIRELI
uniref:Uncharacterized protein n=1 Tax=Biomphalaria glabrata TaxID=6526 RepID=A0A2C9M669_BIOGL